MQGRGHLRSLIFIITVRKYTYRIHTKIINYLKSN